VELDVFDADGGRLQLVAAGGVIVETDIAGDQARRSYDVDVSNTPYLRAQLVDPASGDVRALTNPIYLQ
jgi:hypothetical protein